MQNSPEGGPNGALFVGNPGGGLAGFGYTALTFNGNPTTFSGPLSINGADLNPTPAYGEWWTTSTSTIATNSAIVFEESINTSGITIDGSNEVFTLPNGTYKVEYATVGTAAANSALVIFSGTVDGQTGTGGVIPTDIIDRTVYPTNVYPASGYPNNVLITVSSASAEIGVVIVDGTFTGTHGFGNQMTTARIRFRSLMQTTP